MVGGLVCWLVSWLAGWLVGWLVPKLGVRIDLALWDLPKKYEALHEVSVTPPVARLGG